MKKVTLLASLGLALYGSALDDASKAYQNKNYQKSFEILDKHKRDNFANEKYNYHLCESAYKIKNYRVALNSCERIVNLNPKNQIARYRLGLALAKLYMYEDAKNEFEYLLDMTNLNPKLKPLLKQNLKALKKIYKKDKFGMVLRFGGHYDSNVYESSGKKSINIPAFQTIMKPEKKKADFAHNESIQLTYSKKVNDSDFEIISKIFLTNESYFKQRKQNNIYLGYEPSLAYITRDYDIRFGFQTTKVFKDGKSYISILSLKPSIGFNIAKNAHLSLEAFATRKLYNENYQSYDSDNFGVNVELRHKAYKGSLLYALGYSIEEKRKNDRNDVSHQYYNADLEIYLPVSKKVGLNVINGYKYKRYKDTNKFFLNKRRDRTYNAEVALMYSFVDTWLLRMSYDFTYNNSNQNLYDYTQHLVGLNLYKLFDF